MPFKKGHDKGVKFGSGQPTDKGGAPRGKRLSTILKELLDKNADEFTDDNDFKNLDVKTALALQLIKMVFDKDNNTKDKLSAIKEVLDRIEGKPNQALEIVEFKEQPLFPDVT